jgi:hypothetical protein
VIDPDALSVHSGAGGVVDTLFHCICDSNQAVLIPAPYYPTFDSDLTVRRMCGEVSTLPMSLLALGIYSKCRSASLEYTRGVSLRVLSKCIMVHSGPPDWRLTG